MMILNAFRRYSRILATGWIPGLAIACCLGLGTVGARAQMSQAAAERIEMLRGQIKGAEGRHAGAAEEGGRAMGEALRIARGLTGLPQPVLVNAQLGVMRQYDAFLKATHRKPEAEQMEAEMGRLESRQLAGCNGCTVSVTALGFLH